MNPSKYMERQRLKEFNTMKTETQKTEIRKLTLDSTTGINMQEVFLVEDFNGNLVGRFNSESDALLFMSAPQLLEVCKEALKTMEATEDIGNHQRWHIPEVIRDMLYEAILSATQSKGE